MTDDVRYNWNDLIAQALKPPTLPRPTFQAGANGDGERGYAAAALRSECELVADCPPGSRNDTLNIAALKLGGLVGGGALDRDQVVEQLTVAGLASGLTSTEVAKTIGSGMGAGMRTPRDVPPAPPPTAGLYSLAGLAAPPVTNGHAPPAAEPDQPAEDAPPDTSWKSKRLIDAAVEAINAPVPTHLWREDGRALCYSGKVNGLLGESESGKSWVALLAIAQALRNGEAVLLLDFEDAAGGIYDRLVALGLPDDELDRLQYADPDEALGALQAADLRAGLDAYHFTLVVVDGVNAAMTLLGYDLNSNTDATLFATTLLRPLAKTGACVITVDHVPKNVEARGKGGIGAQAKRAMMDGCALAVEVLDPFGKGQNGVLALTVDKDRPGNVRGVSGGAVRAGRVLLTSEDGAVSIRIAAPDLLHTGDEDGEAFRPTGLMEKVWRYVNRHPEVTSNTICTAIASRRTVVMQAIQLLVDEDYLAVTTGPRRSQFHSVARPYVQADDPASDRYTGVDDLVVPGTSGVVPGTSRVSLVPTGSQPVPGTSSVTGSPPFIGGTGTTHRTETAGSSSSGLVEGYRACNSCGRRVPEWSTEGGCCRRCLDAS
jgi:hypothetical protein